MAPIPAQELRTALERVERRPDDALARFTEAPLTYSTGTSTGLSSPEGAAEARAESKLNCERQSSKPYDQFMHQAGRERKRLAGALAKTGKVPELIDKDYFVTAEHNVKSRWLSQGIWPNPTQDIPDGLWKHEESFETLSHGRSINLKMAFQMGQESEASRPYRQFLHQVKQEEAFILDRTRIDYPEIKDVRKSACKAVRQDWIASRIWDNSWGEMPGMSWKHEVPHSLDAAAHGDARSPKCEPDGPRVVSQPSSQPDLPEAEQATGFADLLTAHLAQSPDREPNEPQVVWKPTSPPSISSPEQDMNYPDLFSSLRRRGRSASPRRTTAEAAAHRVKKQRSTAATRTAPQQPTRRSARIAARNKTHE